MKTTLIPEFALVVTMVASAAQPADQPVLWKWPDLQWTSISEPAGARQALLWGDPKTSAYGAMNRWKFNSKATTVARVHETHFVILAGTLTVEIEGVYREFGPGAYVRVPKRTKYTVGCEASGECRFLMQQSGPADVVN